MPDMIDLETLAESFASVLTEEWPREAALNYAADQHDERNALWKTVADLGWPALTASEEDGGVGLGLDAAAFLHIALGHAVAPLPLMGSTLASTLLHLAGTDAQKAHWLPKIIAGTHRVTVVTQSGWDGYPILQDGRLNGKLVDVVDAPSADLLIFPAQKGDAITWIILDIAASGLTLDVEKFADATRSVASVKLADLAVSEDGILLPADAQHVYNQLLRQACVLMAADSVGAGEAVLAGTVEYLKVREQFGKVIGSFQALKHRVADHQAALVGARELLTHAAGLASDDAEALLLALAAKTHITQIVAEISRDCIQLFGGVGYTAEYFPHLYLKRAKLNEALITTHIHMLDRIADMLEAA